MSIPNNFPNIDKKLSVEYSIQVVSSLTLSISNGLKDKEYGNGGLGEIAWLFIVLKIIESWINFKTMFVVLLVILCTHNL